MKYTYDGLNRLASAGTTEATPVGMQWSRAYVYDGFGNLGATTTTPLSRPVAGYDANAAHSGADVQGMTPPRYEYRLRRGDPCRGSAFAHPAWPTSII